MFGQITKEEFLENYWETSPVVIRNAFDLKDIELDQTELYEMAQDDYFESRLIYQEDGKRKLINGPINTNEIKKHKLWTLFIHNLNLYNENALNLEKAFEFIPKYLFDDVLCSLSSEGSGVGAHVDPYNVFIIQVSGLREWALQQTPILEYKEDNDTKVLKSFTPDQTFILNPGDMLYIPPQVAHQGTSLEESISISVGFNSIESERIINDFLIAASDSDDNQLYNNDSSEFNFKDTFEIGESFVNDLKSIIQQRVSEQSIENWILGFLSRPKKEILPNEDGLSFESFMQKTKDHSLCFDEFSRMMSYKRENKILITLNGELGLLDHDQYLIFKEIFENKHRPFKYESSKLDEFIYSIYQQGTIFFTEEE